MPIHPWPPDAYALRAICPEDMMTYATHSPDDIDVKHRWGKPIKTVQQLIGGRLVMRVSSCDRCFGASIRSCNGTVLISAPWASSKKEAEEALRQQLVPVAIAILSPDWEFKNG